MSIEQERELIWADLSQEDQATRRSSSTSPARNSRSTSQTKKSTTSMIKRTRTPLTPEYVSELKKQRGARSTSPQIQEVLQDDVEDLLGLTEAESSYDPWTACQVTEIKKAMKTSESSVLRAILALQDKRFKAQWIKLESLQAKIESGKRLEGMVNFLYAWVKSAEQNGVHRLPPKW